MGTFSEQEENDIKKDFIAFIKSGNYLKAEQVYKTFNEIKYSKSYEYCYDDPIDIST